MSEIYFLLALWALNRILKQRLPCKIFPYTCKYVHLCANTWVSVSMWVILFFVRIAVHQWTRNFVRQPLCTYDMHIFLHIYLGMIIYLWPIDYWKTVRVCLYEVWMYDTKCLPRGRWSLRIFSDFLFCGWFVVIL